MPADLAGIEPLAPDDPRVTTPLYTINEAARYLGTPYNTLLRWVRPDEGEPLVASVPKVRHRAVLPFVGFAEAFILSVAHHGGMKPQRIRQGVEAIKQKYGKEGIEHALASRLLYHDRTELLLADESRPREPGDLVGDLMVARSNQLQMTPTVANQLRLITYGDDGFAERIALPIFQTRVVVDPREAFGRPIVERTGTRISDVLGMFWANESIKDIAYDYDLEEHEVEDLIRAQTKPAT
jgi:uncharacterized protein (DUF433 family)